MSGSDAQALSGIPTDEVLTAAVSFPPGSVTKMEDNIRAALNSDTKSISMLRTLKLYLERMGTDKQQVGRLGCVRHVMCSCWSCKYSQALTACNIFARNNGCSPAPACRLLLAPR